MATKINKRRLSEAELNSSDYDDEGNLDVETFPIPGSEGIKNPELKEAWDEAMKILDKRGQEIEDETVAYSKDASGHEHKGKGPGGGQFTSSDSGDSSEEKENAKFRTEVAKSIPALKSLMESHSSSSRKLQSHIEALAHNLSGDEQDSKKVARNLAREWAELHDSGGSKEDLKAIEDAIESHGMDKIGEKKHIVDFDGSIHDGPAGSFTGDKHEVVRPGWKHENYVPLKAQTRPNLSTTLNNGKTISFIPHPNQRPDETTIMVDPKKFDEDYKEDSFRINPETGDKSTPGKLENVRKFIESGKPIQASRATILEGKPDLTDGRHRFAELLKQGAGAVAMTIPKDQAAEFEEKYGR